MKKTLLSLILALLLLLCACAPALPEDTAETETDGQSAETVLAPEVSPTVTTPAETEEETAPEPTEEAPKTKRISFLAAGDNVIHACIYQEAKLRAVEGGREYNFKPIYDNIADMIENADIAFINQETLMGGEAFGISSWPRFNSPQDLGYDLQELGFDIINIANNHMCDKGEEALRNTIEFLSALDGVTLLGGHLTKEDFMNIRVVEKEGVKIAFLSYTYGTNGHTLPDSSPLYVPYIDKALIKTQLEMANEIADLTFVSIHWGQENVFTPNKSQTELAQFMAENGADAIIGHHPHVVQPIEWIETESGHKTLCIYSLGNLISAMEYGYNMLGGLFTFDIVKEGDEKPYLDAPVFIPTAFYYADDKFSTKLYLLEDYDQEFSLTHGSRNYGGVASRETMEGYLHDVIDAEFLPSWLTSAS